MHAQGPALGPTTHLCAGLRSGRRRGPIGVRYAVLQRRVVEGVESGGRMRKPSLLKRASSANQGRGMAGLAPIATPADATSSGQSPSEDGSAAPSSSRRRSPHRGLRSLRSPASPATRRSLRGRSGGYPPLGR